MKYEELDKAIIDHIRRGFGHPIYSNVLANLARPLLATNKTPFPEEWRLIDRRMQALRRNGKLDYVRKKGGGHGQWRVVDAA
jgi:hypothetical protein